jgi:peptidoglycan/xylan/chitin deacetylase (PgdA/CDA1 family)
MRKITIVLNILFLILNIGVAGAVTLKADTVETDESMLNKEQATKPVNPAAGKQKLYFKTDGKLYKLDSAGTERRVDASAAVSTFAPLPDLKETRVETFAAGHGYVKQSAAGTQSDDATDYIAGGQSLKLVTDGDGLIVFSRSAVLSPTVDFSGKSLIVQFKVSDVSVVTEFTVYLTSDSFASAWYVFRIDDTNLVNYVGDNEWLIYTMNFSDATVVGIPNRAAINKIQFRIKDDSVSPVTLNMQVLGTMPEPSSGMLTFAFDDGWDSQYDEAKKKMSEVGFPATAYVIKSKIGTAGYMTLTQLHELENLHRWEVSAHHETDLTTVSLTEAESLIRSEKQWLTDNGFNRGSDHFAIPNGALNENLMTLFRRYFRTTRTIGVMAETFPPADWHRLRIFNVFNTTTPTAIATAVDAARTNKTWLILLFHKIVTTPAASTEYSIGNFGTVVDDIAAGGIAVKTISQAINGG